MKNQQNKTEKKVVIVNEQYKKNVLDTNNLYKKQFNSLGQVRFILILFANDIQLNPKFLTLLNKTKKDEKEYKKLLEATRKTKKGSYNVFYTLQALNRLTK